MKVYAPKYYKKFRCIADKCKNSCCIDWEIDVDDATYEKYLRVGGKLKNSIIESNGCRYFRLQNGRCPHLTENGLCEIILRHGESYLTDICREHPRFYNVVQSRKEVGLGLVCEEAARLILTDADVFSLEMIDECNESPALSEYNSLSERDNIISIIVESDIPFSEKVKNIEKTYSVNTEINSIKEWINILLMLETLDRQWSTILEKSLTATNEYDVSEWYSYFERLLIYFVYRHVTSANSYLNLRAKLGFALLGVKILTYLFSVNEKRSLSDLLELARLYSSEIEYSEENTDILVFEFESNFTD